MQNITNTLNAVIPGRKAGKDGVFDTSKRTPALNLGTFSSLSIHSISGGNKTEYANLSTYLDNALIAKLPSMPAYSEWGSDFYKNTNTGFNRIIITNPNVEDMNVSLRLNAGGHFSYATSGGGGGVASHVTIDGTPSVSVSNVVEIKSTAGFDTKIINKPSISIPDVVDIKSTSGVNAKITNKPAVTVPDGVAALVTNFPDVVDIKSTSGVNAKITNKPAVTVPDGVAALVTNFPAAMKVPLTGGKIPVAGDFALAADAKVGITGVTPVGGKLPITGTISSVPSANKCMGSTVTIPAANTPLKVLSARTGRHNITVQGLDTNSQNVMLLDAETAHNTIGIVMPRGGYSLSYSGELWASSTVANQKIIILETFNT